MKKKIFVALIAISMLLITGGCLQGEKDSGNGNKTLLEKLDASPNKTTVYFFWGKGCPHCAEEEEFLEDMKQEYSEEIEVKMFEIYKNQSNVKLFQQVTKKYGTQTQAVPATFIGGKSWVGFSESTGNKIETQIQHCIENKCENPLKEG